MFLRPIVTVPLSTFAYNLPPFATKVAKEKALPFEIWQPNAETIAAMEEDLSKAKSFTSVKDLMADLNADD